MQFDVSNLLEATPEEQGRGWYNALVRYKARLDGEPMPEEVTAQSHSTSNEHVRLGVDDHLGDQPRVTIPYPAQITTVPQQP